MAPTLAMSVTGVAAANALGRAAPLAFVFAALGVGFVAYGFVRLAGEFSHAGSVYAFVGNTLGPRPGFVAGWALLGTYLVFPPVSMMGVAIFGRAFGSQLGQIPSHSEPAERQWRVSPGDEHEVQLGRAVAQQRRDRCVHLGTGDEMVIVEHEHQGSVR